MPQPNPAYKLLAAGWFSNADGSGPYSMAANGTMTLIGGGSIGGGGDASAANQVAGNTTLTEISGKLPTTLGPKTSAQSLSVGPATDALFPVNTLAQVGVARQLAAAASNGTSANTVLTATTRRISVRAVGSAIRYAVGAAPQTASATAHYIAADERLDLAVPANAQIAVLSATTTAAVLEVSELT